MAVLTFDAANVAGLSAAAFVNGGGQGIVGPRPASIPAFAQYALDNATNSLSGINGDGTSAFIATLKVPGSGTESIGGITFNNPGFVRDNPSMFVLETSGGTSVLFSNSSLSTGQQVNFTPQQGDFVAAPVCFVEGTLIATVRGDVAVEDIKAGDVVVTSSGEQRPVRWVGHQTAHCDRYPEPETGWPVRIRRGAFGSGRPYRDLVLSPGHSVCISVVGEILIPAIALVNGTTVTQDPIETVTYWHVELDSHDILVANGLPTESYLEMGNRAFFAEADVVALGAAPDAVVSTHDDFCRPYRDEGLVVEAVRARLREYAEVQGWHLMTPEPWADAYLDVDGQIVLPDVRGLHARFVVPAEANNVWLVSPTSVPRHVVDSQDGRALGLCVSGVSVVNGLDDPRKIALDDPLLCVGFHNPSPGHRWTTARARLPSELWSGWTGPLFLRIALAGPSLPRWVDPEGSDAGLVEPGTQDDVASAA